MQLLPDAQLQRDYSSLASSHHQHPQPREQQPDYPRDYGAQQQRQAATTESQSNNSQQAQEAAGLVVMVERSQQPSQQQPQKQPEQQKNAGNHDGDDIEQPPKIVFKEKLRPGPLPSAQVPPKLPKDLAYIFAENDKKKVFGVKTEKTLEKDFEFGMFLGAIVDEATGCVEESSWELCMQGKILFYTDGKYKRNENWMLHVQCARNAEEQNVEAFQRYGYIHFRTVETVEPGSELRVFYSDEYAKHAGFKTKLDDLSFKKDMDSFQCKECHCFYKSAKRMMRHIKLAHDTEHTGEIRPLFTWEVKKKVAENKQPALAPRVRNADNRFICVKCGKDFPTKGRLTAHETFHDFAGGVHCEYCGEAFETTQALMKHVLSHKAGPSKCGLCGKIYISKNNLRRHEREMHGWTNPMFCQECKKEFEDVDDFKKHKCGKNLTKEPNKEESSRDGKRAAPDKERVIEGGSEQRKDQEKAQDKPSGTEPLSAFPVDMLGKRISYFDRPRPYKCRFCGHKFCQVNQRKYHEQEVHEGKGTYQCPECSQRFVTRCNLRSHMKKHNPIRPFQCQLCPRAFASKSALANHQGEHTGLKPYKCTICSRGFRTQKLMGKHRSRMHGKREKRFACSFCDKLFMTRSSWHQHERRHKGIRPFVCLVCGKGFSSKDSMAVHQRVHTGEMPFTCEKCGKPFRNNHNLTAHLLHHARKEEKEKAKK